MKFILSLILGIDVDREEKTELQWKNMSGFTFTLFMAIWVYIKKYDYIYSLSTLGILAGVLTFFALSALSVFAFRKMPLNLGLIVVSVTVLAFIIICWDEAKGHIPFLSAL